jgi:hypothetical protein
MKSEPLPQHILSLGECHCRPSTWSISPRLISLSSSTSSKTCLWPPPSTGVCHRLNVPLRRTDSTPLHAKPPLGKLCRLIPLLGVLPLTPSCSCHRPRHPLASEPPPPAVPPCRPRGAVTLGPIRPSTVRPLFNFPNSSFPI